MVGESPFFKAIECLEFLCFHKDHQLPYARGTFQDIGGLLDS